MITQEVIKNDDETPSENGFVEKTMRMMIMPVAGAILRHAALRGSTKSEHGKMQD